jgi:thiamine kinase-like enzyme
VFSSVPEIIRRAGDLLNKRLSSWHSVEGGYTSAARWIVTFDDGSSCFLKAGVDIYTAEQVRAEYRLYARLEAQFLPRLIGWQDDGGDSPILVLEDLSAAFWPPPWSDSHIQLVLKTLDMVHGRDAPWLPRVRELDTVEDWLHYWGLVAAQPGEFLSLGHCSQQWLDRAAPILLAAAVEAPIDGDSLIHLDIRSDNLCFVGNRGVIIDWNFACRGNPDVDLACWLPSLQSEGGPRPESVLPTAPELAALVAGYFALHAGKPRGGARDIQKEQLRTALPWAVRALGLPALDGSGQPH